MTSIDPDKLEPILLVALRLIDLYREREVDFYFYLDWDGKNFKPPRYPISKLALRVIQILSLAELSKISPIPLKL